MTSRRVMQRLIRVVLYTLAVVAIVTAIGIAYFVATLYTAGAAQKGYLALTRATVLVGEELVPRERTTVLIRDGLIAQIGDDGEVGIPSEAIVIDLSGYTLMPGLVDLHVHMGSPELQGSEWPGVLSMPGLILDYMQFFPDRRRALLNHGVTTVRSLGDDYGWVMELRQMLRDGELEGPRLYAAGPMFTTPGGHPVATFGVDPQSGGVRLPSSPAEARDAVRELAGGEDGVDLIKVIQERGGPNFPMEPIAPEVLRAIVEEAHGHGIPVFAHWGTLEDLEDVLTAGVDGLEHLEARGALEGWPAEVLEALLERDVSLSPTLAATHAVLPPQVHQQLRQRVAEFHAVGGRLVVGSDAPMQGVPFGAGVHREMELLVESGLAPREALVAATREAARALGTDAFGAITPGRAADLAVVDGDPLGEIQAARHVVMVFRDGRVVVDRRCEERTP